MKSVNKNLSEEFSIEPIIDINPVISETEIVPVKEEIKSDLKKDYVDIRSNIKSIIKKSDQALDNLLNIAKETDNARAYEVAADLIRTTLEANEKLMQLHQKVKEIENIGNITTNINSTNNSIYVGSTKDLINLIKQHKQAVNEANILENNNDQQ